MAFWSRKPPPAAPTRVEPKFRVRSASSILPAPRPVDTSAFRIHPPTPGVVPSGVATMAQDRALGDLYAYAAGQDYHETLFFQGYQFLAELAQRPEYRRMVESIANEMTRKWIRLQANGDEPKTLTIKVLEDALKEFRVQDAFRRAAELDGFFGRGQIYFDTGSTDEPEELKVPLILSKQKIPIGGLKRLIVLDPMWTYPGQYNSIDPLRKDHYKPSSWWVQGKEVHASRMLTFVSREVPDLLKPAYQFGGLSLTQISRPYVENWLRTRQSVSDLVHSFSVSGVMTDMGDVLQGDNLEEITNRADMFNRIRDTRGLFIMDKDKEEYFNVSTPLSTLDHLQAQSQEQMASVSGIPLVKLLGITPSGLNASTDGEIRAFYDWIEALCERVFTDKIKTVLEVIQLSKLGAIDPSIGFRYEKLWSTDEAEAATVRKTNADTAAAYINAGVLSPEEERTRLANEEDGFYDGLNPADIPEPPDQGGEGDDPFAGANEDDGDDKGDGDPISDAPVPGRLAAE